MPALIRSIQHLGYAHAARRRGWALAGQDGGQSIELDGKSLFLFSDTLLARTGHLAEPLPRTLGRDNALFLGNCAGIASGHDLADALSRVEYFSRDGYPCEILAATPGERFAGRRFWPEHGTVVEGKVIFYYIGIRHFDQGSAWGFQGVGSGIAMLNPVTGECERVRREGLWQYWPVIGDDLHFGTQVLREGPLLYVFSSRRRGPDSEALLARVPVDSVLDLNAYEYWTAGAEEWTKHFEDSCPVTGAANEFSVSFNPYLGCYLMVYVDSWTKRLCLRTAPFLWGPYSEPQISSVLPHREEAGIVSLGFEHPQFRGENGRIICISYCQPGFTQNSLVVLRFA
jgi:hypothetical protein